MSLNVQESSFRENEFECKGKQFIENMSLNVQESSFRVNEFECIGSSSFRVNEFEYITKQFQSK